MTQNSPTKPHPQIGTGVFLLRPNGSFLIGHRISKNGYDTWGLVGGHPEFGEDPVDAICRETREEAGLRIHRDNLSFGGYSSDIFPDSGKHYITMFFIARVGADCAPKLCEPDKIDEWRWVFYDELPENLMAPFQGFIDRMGPGGLRHLMATAPRDIAA